MKYLRTDGAFHYFYFVCEGCGEAGELGVPDDMMSKTVACPEECGAVYIMWKNPLTASPDLKCVVCPVYVGEMEETL